MTVLEVIQASTGYLEKHGIESPRLNSEHLASHVLGMKRIQLYLDYERHLDESELQTLRGLAKRRTQGEPLQHLLGTAIFLGHTFKCDRRALIPRPETEQLAEYAIARIKQSSAPLQRLLDVGTGSGVLAISLALEFQQLEIVATDIGAEALQCAKENAESLDVAHRISFALGDLFASTTGNFQFIIANLPYIPTDEIATLSNEVRHDPALALDGGPDGTTIIRRCIEQAQAHLSPGGILALEIGAGQAPALAALLRQKNYGAVEILRDYQGQERFLFATNG